MQVIKVLTFIICFHLITYVLYQLDRNKEDFFKLFYRNMYTHFLKLLNW